MIQLENKSLAGLCVYCAVALSVNASPLLTLGDNAAVYFVGSASVASDSNVTYANSDKLDDIIIDVRPGFEFVAGSPLSGAEFALSASYGLRRYMDYDEFDTELPAVVGTATFKSPKSTTVVKASYIETQAENRRGERGLVLKSGITNVGFLSDYEASAKTSVVGGVSYSDTNREVFGSDYSDLSVPINLYYSATEKLDVGVGYRYRDSSVDDSFFGDRTSHFFNVALRGELTPKLVADVKVGLQTTDLDGGDSVDGLGLDAKLTYSASDKFSADLVFSKDALVGFAGEVIDNTSLAAVGTFRFSPLLAANAMVVYGTDDYKQTFREDDYLVFELGVSYAPLQYMSFDAGYAFTENDSNINALDFTKSTLSVSVNVRY